MISFNVSLLFADLSNFQFVVIHSKRRRMMENGYDTKENVFSSMDTLNNIKNDRKKDDESARPDSKKCDSTLREKHLTGFFKSSFKTLSIPKKAVSEKGSQLL